MQKVFTTISYFLPLMVIAIYMSSCQKPKALEYKSYSNFKVEKVGLSDIQLAMDLVYYNPNNVGLQLKRTDLDVYINDNFLGTTSQEYQITIAKKSDFTLPLHIKVDGKNIFKNLFATLFNKEITVKVTGKVKVGKANVFINYPVNYEGKHSF
jgi:LEA14-like dessication related protein